MEAGRELDKAIAEKLFNFKLLKNEMFGTDGWCFPDSKGSFHSLYHFSTDIDDAYLVINVMQKKYNMNFFSKTLKKDGEQWYQVGFHRSNQTDFPIIGSLRLPHAICVAALNVINGKRIKMV